jgi:tetratricopeptide (TPR) repeat protein
MNGAAKSMAPGRMLVLVALIAVFVRVLFWVQSQEDPILSLRAIDEASYDDLARRFASGDFFFGRDTLWFAPLYPVLLGLLYAVLGPNPQAMILLQHVMGIGSAILVVRTGHRMGLPIAGGIAGMMLAILPTLLHAESRLLATAPLVLATASFLIVFIGALSRENQGRPALAGVLLGACGLLRGNALAFAPFGMLLIGRARGTRAAASFAAGVFVMLLPVLLRNGLLANEWTPWTANGGMILATSFAEQSLGGRALERTPEDFAPGGAFHREAERALGRKLTLGEAGEFHHAQAISRIRSDPAAALALTGRKLALLFNAREIDDNLSFTLARPRSLLLSWLPAPWAFVMIPAVMGSMLALAGRDAASRWMRVLLLFAGVLGATLLLFFVTGRYRMPLLVPGALLAGWGIQRALWTIRMRRWNEAALLILTGGVAGIFILRDPGVAPDQSLEMTAIGAAFERRGDHQEALRATDEAIRINPKNPGAWHNRGLSLLGLGRREEAMSSLNEALRLDPDLGPAWQMRGAILAEENRLEEALRDFRRAAELMPESPGALSNLAHALGRTNQCAEAVDVGKRAREAGAAQIEEWILTWEEWAKTAKGGAAK